MKIAIIIDDMYPSYSGVGRSVETQIYELVKLNHQVTLIAPSKNLTSTPGCSIVALASYRLPGLPKHFRIFRTDKRQAKLISLQHKFDVVHSQTDIGALILAARLAKLQQIPHIHTFHTNVPASARITPFASKFLAIGYRLTALQLQAIAPPVQSLTPPKACPNMSKTERSIWKAMSTISRSVSAVTSPSQDILDGLLLIGTPNMTIPTGISHNFTTAIKSQPTQRGHEGEIHFLSLSRLAREKRIDVMIDAFLLADIPGSFLHIVGSGEFEPALRKKSKSNPRILFHGQLNSFSEVAQAYLSSDIFLMASYGFDTQAVSLAEAATAGLPIIYCDDRLHVGVSPKNSILTNDPSAESIAKAMKQLSSQSLRKNMSTESLAIAKSLAPQKMAKQYVNFYSQAIDKYKKQA